MVTARRPSPVFLAKKNGKLNTLFLIQPPQTKNKCKGYKMYYGKKNYFALILSNRKKRTSKKPKLADAASSCFQRTNRVSSLAAQTKLLHYINYGGPSCVHKRRE